MRGSSAALFIAALAAVLPLVALAGYVFNIPVFLSFSPEVAAMSPLSALALLLIGASIARAAARGERAGGLSAGVSLTITLSVLMSHGLYGSDLISAHLAHWINAGALQSGRMSIGTSVCCLAVAVALLPPVRRRGHAPDALCGLAMFISGIALLGYAYGTLDLYGLPLFKTMAVRTALSIFLFAGAGIILRQQNGWWNLLIADNAAGAVTRRQLLLALGAPLLGWLVLHQYQDAHLGVGASLAIFVAITTVPLLWLILRDGHLLNDLLDSRRTQRESAALHTRDLEERLAGQALLLERKSAEQVALAGEARIHSDNRYRVLFQSIDAGFCVIEMLFDADNRPVDYRFLETNTAFEALTGLGQAQGRRMREMVPLHEQHWFDVYGEVATSQTSKRFEQHAEKLDDRWYDVHAFPVDEPALHRVGVLFNDITASRRAAQALHEVNLTLEDRVATAIAEREQVQQALRQSQKMEAVGQLTGGLAHDFNNLLQGITGSLEVLNTRAQQGRLEDVGRYVAAAQGAARRAASLTHRLLAFSRRQTLEPKATDVNRLVTGMEDLIRRTVGPHINVENIAAGGLWNTLVDPSQLENALLNLCINARDAMPAGGRLTIETGNKWLDHRAAGERELEPGQYVTLSVSDNGCGMSADVIARAFDPFFTTKPLGMGTGLGLSMIYGFAKQSGGQVRIHSKVGQGSMVSIWLPRHAGQQVEDEAAPERRESAGAAHDETILVVDDEPTVRMLIKDVLDELGFFSIEAADGAAALRVLESDARIDLLITDVGLPGGMNGRQVADAARALRSDLVVLFITGYAENAVLSHGHLPAGMHVLTKPFRMEAIAARIQDLIANEVPGTLHPRRSAPASSAS